MRVGSELVDNVAGQSDGDYLAFSLQVKALSRLHDLALALAETPEPQPALQAILETLVEVHSADFGLLSLYEAETGCLVPYASIGFDSAALEDVSRVVPGPQVGACGSAFWAKTRAIVHDVEIDERFDGYRGLAQSVGFRSVHSTPILTRQGEAVGVLAVQFRGVRGPTDMETQMADLCARHAADAMEIAKSRRSMRESELRFTRFMEHLPGLAWIKDEAGRYVYANAAAQKAFQAPVSRLYGKTDDEIFAAETAAHFRANDELALKDEAGIRTVEMLEHPDGTLHASLVNKFPIPGIDGAEPMIGGMAIDVTDKQRAEEALRESEQRFRNMADHAPVMIWVTEADGSCSFLGKTWYEFTGRSAD
jgi:two-component system cell cycle sensor histidine kinase/response regulator CckA